MKYIYISAQKISKKKGNDACPKGRQQFTTKQNKSSFLVLFSVQDKRVKTLTLLASNQPHLTMQQPPPFEASSAPVPTEQDAMNLPLDDDLLAEIFRHLDDPASLNRCQHVCKRFYNVISVIFRMTPIFLGFYHVPNINRWLPQYMHT
jgi:F-box-like